MSNPLNIINEIQSPDLSQEHFAESLNQAIETINDNFKKIVSAPIYRGQQGESVKIKSVSLIDGNSFTEEGKKIVSAIYNDVNLSSWDGTKIDLATKLAGTKYDVISGTRSFDYINDNNFILMFYLDNVEETLLAPAQLYVFQDARVTYFPNVDGNNVKDASCYITFEWDEENSTYRYTKSEQFPTITWSPTVGDYVWTINGHDTNIIAKGLKGTNAVFRLPLFKATNETTLYTSQQMFHTNSNTWGQITSEDVDDLLIGMTSVVYIVNDDYDTISGLEITTIQSIDEDNDQIQVYLNKQGFSVETKDLDIMLNDIRPFESEVIENTKIAGLYIPAKTNSNDVELVHAMWRNREGDDCDMLNVGYACKTITDDKMDFDTNISKTTSLNLINYQNILFNMNQNNSINNFGGIGISSHDNKWFLSIYRNNAINPAITIDDTHSIYFQPNSTFEQSYAMKIGNNVEICEPCKMTNTLEVEGKFITKSLGEIQGSFYIGPEANRRFSSSVNDGTTISNTRLIQLSNNGIQNSQINIISRSINLDGTNINLKGATKISNGNLTLGDNSYDTNISGNVVKIQNVKFHKAFDVNSGNWWGWLDDNNTHHRTGNSITAQAYVSDLSDADQNTYQSKNSRTPLFMIKAYKENTNLYLSAWLHDLNKDRQLEIYYNCYGNNLIHLFNFIKKMGRYSTITNGNRNEKSWTIAMPLSLTINPFSTDNTDEIIAACRITAYTWGTDNSTYIRFSTTTSYWGEESSYYNWMGTLTIPILD